MKKQIALIAVYVISIVFLVIMTQTYHKGDSNTITHRVVAIAFLVILVSLLLAVLLLVSHNRELWLKNERLYENMRREMDHRQRALMLRRKMEAQIDEMKSKLEEKENPKEKTKYESSNLDKKSKEELLLKIITVFDTSDAIYSSQFTLKQLAELVGSNYKYVSQTINESLNMNYASLLNDYRIKEVCRRMCNTKEYANQTIEAIAESVGYKSRTSFIAAFKRVMGITPSEFQRQAIEHQD